MTHPGQVLNSTIGWDVVFEACSSAGDWVHAAEVGTINMTAPKSNGAVIISGREIHGHYGATSRDGESHMHPCPVGSIDLRKVTCRCHNVCSLGVVVHSVSCISGVNVFCVERPSVRAAR